MSSASNPSPPTDVSLSSHHEKARSIVLALAQPERDGRANASELRSATINEDTEQVRYHADRLAALDPPLVERTGEKENVGAPKPAVVYRLTDAGEQAAEAYTDIDTGLTIEEQVEYLTTAVRSLRDDLDAAEQRADHAHERIDVINDYLHGRSN